MEAFHSYMLLVKYHLGNLIEKAYISVKQIWPKTNVIKREKKIIIWEK
jgi:ribosomal protein L36